MKRILFVIALILAAVTADCYYERWIFNECLNVGHSFAYCVTQ